MKKTRKILIGFIAGLGISSLIALGCGLAFSNVNLTANSTANSTNITNSTSSQNATNNLTSTNPVKKSIASATNTPATSDKVINDNASANHLKLSKQDISNDNKLAYHTLDTSTLNAAINNTFTYQCANGNTLLFSANNDNSATLLGFSKKVVNTSLIIPNTVINGNNFYAVTNIAAGAFYGQNLTSVTFDANLLSIGTLAFANNNLTKLTFPAHLQSIGDKAFISNQFPHAYAVYLPNNTTWSKNWLTSPFNTKDNLSKLVNGIQFVIQGNAVYEFQANQNEWTIVSYDITNNFANNSTWGTATSTWGTGTIDNTSQASYSFDSDKNVNVPLATSLSGNLDNFALYTECQGSIGWIFYFDGQNQTFNIDLTTQDGNLTPVFNNPDATATFSVSLYDPYSGKYIINWQDISASTTIPPTSAISFSYQPGDILSYSVNNVSNGSWAYIASNFNYSLLSPDTGAYSGSLNQYIDLSYAWTNQKGLTNSFAIKPNGIYPTISTTSLSNVSYDPSTGLLDLVGTSLPNMQYGVDYDNKQVGTFDTNNDGNINASLNITKNLTATNDITIQAIAANDGNSNVIYPCPDTVHLQGFNPKQSFLNLSIGGVSTQILFNGFTNKLAIANISNTWPAYASAYGNYATTSPSTSNTFSSSGSFGLDVTNANNKTTDYSFSYTSGESANKLYSFIESIPYANGDTYTFTGDDYSFGSVYDNGVVVGYGSSVINNVSQSSFLVTTNGITCTTNQTTHDWYLGAVNDYYCYGANTRRWSATYGWAACFDGDYFSTDENVQNWYDPNQTMVDIANQISASYTNPVNKVIAIFNWVANNMHYTSSYSYYHTIRGNFSHLEGVCGNYADVFGALLKLDGFVSRQVWGSVDTVNVNNIGDNLKSDLDHEWVQVWMPTLQEWITLDPTWDWSLPFGDIEAKFNTDRCDMSINLVEWPSIGTDLYYDSYGTLSYKNYEYDNYFSYFKGCEYQALLNLGRHFDIVPGMKQSTYEYTFAQGIANVISWAANPSNSISNNTYVMDNMYLK